MLTDALTTEDLLHETPAAIASEESLQVGATLTPEMLRQMTPIGEQQTICRSDRSTSMTIRS
jgi:hypothetical protein